MWEEQNKKAVQLFRSGRHTEAMAMAQEALKEAEESFGPDDARVATSLNNLAECTRAQVRHAEAEPLWKRALEIRKKRWGRPSRCLHLMNNLAGAYFELGDFAKAEHMLTGALRISERSQDRLILT